MGFASRFVVCSSVNSAKSTPVSNGMKNWIDRNHVHIKLYGEPCKMAVPRFGRTVLNGWFIL